MSELTNYASGLTLYKENGLELFIHRDGSVYASQSAMSRMLEVPESTLRGVLSNREFSSVVPLEAQTRVGGKQARLYPAKTLVTLARKYNPELSDKFSEMGATVYLYQLAGYKVRPVVEAPTQEPSQLEQAKYMANILQKHIEQLAFLQDKPGLAAKMALAHQDKALDTWMDIDELAALAEVTFDDHGQKCKMSARVAQAYQNDTHVALPKVKVNYKDKNGKQQSALRTRYNVACVSYLKSAMASI